MGLIVTLSEHLHHDAVERSLDEAPYHEELRDAATEVIAAVHGLPDAMNAKLSQIEVYVGRAGATPTLVKNRWAYRFEAFKRKPSCVALVVFQAPTYFVRTERWERAAQLLIRSLKSAGALCCANVLTGDSGRWPETDECAIYMVARKRKGPRCTPMQESDLHTSTLPGQLRLLPHAPRETAPR